ncbi:uncharacterized protein LOC141863650 [Acropora palmata]|uniref:uncharacterized protein LOC141863650 n=1 Tax=Acropora palmata TaxID=6131 RepID=UPI003DA00922
MRQQTIRHYPNDTVQPLSPYSDSASSDVSHRQASPVLTPYSDATSSSSETDGVPNNHPSIQLNQFRRDIPPPFSILDSSKCIIRRAETCKSNANEQLPLAKFPSWRKYSIQCKEYDYFCLYFKMMLNIWDQGYEVNTMSFSLRSLARAGYSSIETQISTEAPTWVG